eukprot:UN01924
MPASVNKQPIKLAKTERKLLLLLLHELAFNAGTEHCQNKRKIQNTDADNTMHAHREILANFIDQNDFAIKQIIPDIQSGTHEECWMDYLYPNWREYKHNKTISWSISLKIASEFGQKCLNVLSQNQSNLYTSNTSQSTIICI